MVKLIAIFVGTPQEHSDARGAWRSSIYRMPVNQPVFLTERGLTGDQVTDTRYHGSPDQAVCCHDQSHYDYWNDAYALVGDARLGPGGVGENWTLTGGSEAALCVGDTYAVGGALVQVTAPRYPCPKQERKLGLPRFSQRSQETMRTGFYLRVLRTGWVKAGDEWILEARPQPAFSLELINTGMLRECDLDLVRQMMDLPELADGWKEMLRHRWLE